MKKLILTLCFLFACSTGWAAVENFSTAWTETDPNGRLSQTATRSTWTNLRNDSTDTKLTKDADPNLTAPIDIKFSVYFNSSSDKYSIPSVFFAAKSDLSNILELDAGEGTNSVMVYFAWQDSIGSNDYFLDDAVSLDTLYYVRIKDSGSTISFAFYGTESNMQNETNAVISDSWAHTGTITINIVEAPGNYDDSSTADQDGYLENLDLAYVPPSVVPPVIIIEESQAEQEYKSRHCRLESQVTDKICWRCCEDENGCLIDGCELPQEDAFLFWKPEWEESLLKRMFNIVKERDENEKGIVSTRVGLSLIGSGAGVQTASL